MEVTGTTSVALQPAYYSYAAALQPEVQTYCGSSTFTFEASADRQTQSIELPEYKIPKGSTTIPEEYACVYTISGPELEYKNSAEIVIYANSIQGGNLYVYQGTDRTNMTDIGFQTDTKMSAFAVGAPVSLKISDGAVLVFKKSSSAAAQFEFGYEIDGELYPWWEQIFLG